MGWGFHEWMREQAGENIAAWQDHLQEIQKFEAHLWKSADNLRAN
jgi:hypothetical protein